MKNKLLLLITMLIIACNSNDPNKRIKEMSHPIVIIGIDTTENCVTFMDATGETFSSENTTFSKAVCKSRQVGDTLRY